MSDAEDRKEAKKTLAKLKNIPRDKLTIDQQADLLEAQGILRTPPPKPKKPTASRKAGGKIRSKKEDARKDKMSAPKKSKKEGPGIRIVDGITFDTRTKSMFPTEERKKGGKVIKKNMSGDDLVRSCYD